MVKERHLESGEGALALNEEGRERCYYHQITRVLLF